MMPVRGIRGAITVKQDDAEAIIQATRELLLAIQQANQALHSEEIASILFTVTSDLTAAFPAKAARQIGWELTPVIDAQEVPVPGSLPRCIRVLMHWNTDLPQAEIKHVYLSEAASLRPDLTRSQ